MTQQRIEQLRRVEQTALAACAAHARLLQCIESPKLWSEFEARVKHLNDRLNDLLEACAAPVEVSAPEPLTQRTDARQLRIEEMAKTDAK